MTTQAREEFYSFSNSEAQRMYIGVRRATEWVGFFHNGGNPDYSRHLRSLLLQAGFVKTAGYAVAADHYGTLEETRRLAKIIERLLRDPDLVQTFTSQGWATQTELDEIVRWIQDWSERPDAFFAIMYCAAVGWNS